MPYRANKIARKQHNYTKVDKIAKANHALNDFLKLEQGFKINGTCASQ